MSNEMTNALNTQLNNELYSAYLYLGMSAYFKSKNLSGFAKWLKIHAQEETMHAMKIYDFVINRNWQLNLLPIKAPETTWNSPIEIFTASYQHEQQVTKMLNNLAKLAIEKNDYATNIFLQWFITEQIEEEAVFNEILDKIKLADGTPSALIFLDAELDKKATAGANSQTP
jgi:ferritin